MPAVLGAACSLSRASSLLTKLLVLLWEVECECERDLRRHVDTFDLLDLVVGSSRHELLSPPSWHPRCSNQAATRRSNSTSFLFYETAQEIPFLTVFHRQLLHSNTINLDKQVLNLG